MKKIKRMCVFMVVCMVFSVLTAPISYASTPQLSEGMTVAELLDFLDIPVDSSTVVKLDTTNSPSACSADSQSSSKVYTPSLEVSLIAEDGTICEYSIIAANDTTNGIETKNIEVDISNVAAASRPTPTLTANTVDYASLSSAYDYYFVLGTSYTTKVFSDKYAFRPTAMWMLIRPTSTATKTVSRVDYAIGIHGEWVNSSGSIYDSHGTYSFTHTVTRNNPPMDSQMYVSLSSLWTEEGFGSTDYLWLNGTLDTPKQYRLLADVYYADGKVAGPIEHLVYS